MWDDLSLWFCFALVWWIKYWIFFHIPLAICMFALEKYLFGSFILKLGCFLAMRFLSSLYILDINPLSDVWFPNIFSHSVGCCFTLFYVSFAVQKRKTSLEVVFPLQFFEKIWEALVSILCQEFGRNHQWSHQVLAFYLLGGFFGLFVCFYWFNLLTHYWLVQSFSFFIIQFLYNLSDRLYVSRNSSISFQLFSLLVCKCS